MNLHPIPAPRYASTYEWDCARCAHEALKHPVFLSDGRAYGTGCAAYLMGVDGRTAAREALAADTELAGVVAFLNMCRPGRITPQFVAELEARFYRLDAGQIDRAVTLWKMAR